MKTIALTGMMGSGKTTIAKLLSQKLNIEYIDIDNLIKKKESLSISDIFSKKGEVYFRDLEQQTIQKIFKNENQIISLGGGALENTDTRTFLSTNATIIYLKTSPETIFNRIKNDNSRPLLKDNMSPEQINKIIHKRQKNYEIANIIINTDEKLPEQIIDEIIGVLK